MPFSVLVVCLANVCRSPLGERLLAHRLGERGPGLVDADSAGSAPDERVAYAVGSAGVRAFEGREMSPQSAVELERRGGSAMGFAATQLGRDHRGSDLVLVATRELRSKVLEQLPGLMKRTFTIRELAAILHHLRAQAPEELAAVGSPADLVRLAAAHRTAVTLAEDADVPDPIGRSDEVYAEVAAMLDEALTLLADELARVAATPESAGQAAGQAAGQPEAAV